MKHVRDELMKWAAQQKIKPANILSKPVRRKFVNTFSDGDEVVPTEAAYLKVLCCRFPSVCAPGGCGNRQHCIMQVQLAATEGAMLKPDWSGRSFSRVFGGMPRRRFALSKRRSRRGQRRRRRLHVVTHAAIGTSTHLEWFLLKRKLMGPCWLRIKPDVNPRKSTDTVEVRFDGVQVEPDASPAHTHTTCRLFMSNWVVLSV
jgi:hypothetical protein